MLMFFFGIMLQGLLLSEIWSSDVLVGRFKNLYKQKVEMMSDDSNEEDVSSFFCLLWNILLSS